MDSGQLTMDSEQGMGTDPIRVLRVAEGQARTADDGTPCRIFSVVLSRPAGEDLGVVAAARDPGVGKTAEPGNRNTEPGKTETTSVPGSRFQVPGSSPCHIPAPGEPHPTLNGYAARPPLIFSVGIRSKDGAMLAACSNFYNVRVRYEQKETAEPGTRNPEPGETETTANLSQAPGSGFQVPGSAGYPAAVGSEP